MSVKLDDFKRFSFNVTKTSRPNFTLQIRVSFSPRKIRPREWKSKSGFR